MNVEQRSYSPDDLKQIPELIDSIYLLTSKKFTGTVDIESQVK